MHCGIINIVIYHIMHYEDNRIMHSEVINFVHESDFIHIMHFAVHFVNLILFISCILKLFIHCNVDLFVCIVKLYSSLL